MGVLLGMGRGLELRGYFFFLGMLLENFLGK